MKFFFKSVNFTFGDNGVYWHLRYSLIKHFKNIKAISSASPEELAKADVISPLLAQNIYNHFRKKEGGEN